MTQDRQQVLAAIDALLLQQPITSQHLANFTVEHPDVVGQQGIKDDLPRRDSDSDTVPCDSVSLPADTSTADTSINTADADSSISATPTRRLLLHKSVPRSFTRYSRVILTICGRAYEARRLMLPQNLGPRGTLWSVPPQNFYRQMLLDPCYGQNCSTRCFLLD